MASSLRFLVRPSVDTSVSCLGLINVSLARSTPVLVLAFFGHTSVLKLQFQLIAQWFPLLSFDGICADFAVPVQDQMRTGTCCPVCYLFRFCCLARFVD